MTKKTYTLRDRLFVLSWLHALIARAETEGYVVKAIRLKDLSIEVWRNLGKK